MPALWSSGQSVHGRAACPAAAQRVRQPAAAADPPVRQFCRRDVADGRAAPQYPAIQTTATRASDHAVDAVGRRALPAIHGHCPRAPVLAQAHWARVSSRCQSASYRTWRSGNFRSLSGWSPLPTAMIACRSAGAWWKHALHQISKQAQPLVLGQLRSRGVTAGMPPRSASRSKPAPLMRWAACHKQ